MKRLEEIQWHTLHHAYGTCEEFPRIVQALAANQPKVRSHARHWLEELLFHQGTHYEANQHAVPFLLQAAANPELPERLRLFEFLNRFLFSNQPPLAPWQRAERNRRLQKQLRYDFGEGSAAWRDERRLTVAATWANRELLVGMVQHDPHAEGRCWAIFALANLVALGRVDGGGWTDEKPTSWYLLDDVRATASLFRERVDGDASVAVRVAAAFGLGYLRDEPSVRTSLKELFAQDDVAVRTAAAAALHLVEPHLAEEYSRCLIDGIVQHRFHGQRAGYATVHDPDHPLARAYANIGMPLVEAGTIGSQPASSPFAAVPFPTLSAWLNAAFDERIPVATMVEQRLEDASPKERVRAVRLLGKIKRPQANVLEVLQRLLHYNDSLIRMTASVAIRRLDRRRPVSSIVAVFRAPLRSRRASIRRLAVAGLLSMWTPGKGGPIPKALPWVAALAERETDVRVQKLICKFIERAAIEDSSANEALQQVQRVVVRWLANPLLVPEALTALRDHHERELPTEALEPLLTLLMSEHPARALVPHRLVRVKSDRVLPAMLEVFATEKDAEVRTALGWAIQKLPNPSKVVVGILAELRAQRTKLDEVLANTLVLLARTASQEQQREVAQVVLDALQQHGTTAPTRAKLAEAIGWLTIEPTRVADTLLHLALRDDEAFVRATAANALACSRIPVADLLPRVVQIAEQGDDAAVEGLLRLLDHGNTPEMPDLARSLLPLLQHANYERRMKTLAALTRMAANDEEVERAVLRAFDDPHTSVRDQAIRYDFKILPNEVVLPALLKALQQDEPSGYAWWSLIGFGPHGDIQPRAPLGTLLSVAMELLAKQNGLFVSTICDWLKEQGEHAKSVVPALIAQLESPSAKDRVAKIEALLAIDPTQHAVALKALEPLVNHELDCVRDYVAQLRERIGRP